jgi:cyclic-di-AMP phosphodiesterase PgpH
MRRKGESATRVLLVLACAAATGLLLEAGPRQEMPWLSERDVGRAAPRDIKATRSFEVQPSGMLLEQARDEAARRVLPVYDYDVGRATEVLGRIHHAFAVMHEPAVRAVAPEARRARFEAALGVPVARPAFEPLDRTLFPAELRAALAYLVGSEMERMVVAERADLGPGIAVRHGAGTGTREHAIRDAGELTDLDEARAALEGHVETHYAALPPDARRALAALGGSLLVPTLVPNPAATEERRAHARAAVAPRAVPYVPGQVIVREGEVVTAEHVAAVQAMRAAGGAPRALRVLLGTALLVALMIGVILSFAIQRVGPLFVRPRDLVAMGFLLLAFVGLARGAAVLWGQRVEGAALYPYALPLAAGAMLVRMVLGARGAALFALTVGVLGAIAVDGSAELAAYYVVCSIAGAAGVSRVQSRRAVLRAGVSTGLVAALTCLFLGMRGTDIAGARMWASLCGVGMVSGLLAALLTTGLLPILELLGYTTDITLLELANLNHPLLRDLMLRAPGTYHHSMVVGSLAEAACDDIGANGLLARVAAYFHDLGKSRNAGYFAENFEQPGSPHGRLRPSMSALIIRSHVKDTAEILREHRMPAVVVQTATQHHGTTLIEYFHHKALQQKGDDEVTEQDYRYVGPKPQSREAGVLMLADGVEAAARSLPDAAEDRLAEVVNRIVNKKFADGQLDECALTLRDLHVIARSFLQALRGIYHQRPAYPWQEQPQKRERRRTQPGGEREVPDAGLAPGPAARTPVPDWDVTEENAAEGRGALRRLGLG